MRFGIALLLLANAHAAIAADHPISFVCCAYSPATLTIAPGDRVIWNGTFASHPLREVTGPNSDTPVPGGFASSSGTTFNQTFNTPGVYYFQCTAHGLTQFGGTMRGSITVASPDAVYANGFE